MTQSCLLRMFKPDGVIGMAVVLLSAVFPVDGFSGSRSAIGIDGTYSGKQGQILVVKVPTDEESARVQGQLRTLG